MRRLALVLAFALAFATGQAHTAHAEVVAATVHGWFSGPGEVWAGKFAVDLKLKYRAHKVEGVNVPGFVQLGQVNFDIRDPAGNPSTQVFITYSYFLETRPAPLLSFGTLDPYEADITGLIHVTASASAALGTWRIRPRVQDFHWILNGVYMVSAATITTTEDWYSITVREATPATAPNPATTTAAPRPAARDSRTGAIAQPATTESVSPVVTPAQSNSPSPSVATPSSSTTDRRAAAPASTPTWPYALLIGVVAAAAGFGLPLLWGRVRRRKR